MQPPPAPFIEVFEPQMLPSGEYAASARVHLGPEGSVRIVATAPQAVAAKAMAHAQAFLSKHLGPSVRIPPGFGAVAQPLGLAPLSMPPSMGIPSRPIPSHPSPVSFSSPSLASFSPASPAPPPAAPTRARPDASGGERAEVAQARAMIHQAAAAQPLALETARAARRFVPILRPLSAQMVASRAARAGGAMDLAQLFERASLLLEAAERDPEARQRLADAVQRARRDGRLLQVLQAVRVAERRDGAAGVDTLKRLAGATSLLGRAHAGEQRALTQLRRVVAGALSPEGAEPSAARATGYLSVADAELLPSHSTAAAEVGASEDELELLRALRGMRTGFRRSAR